MHHPLLQEIEAFRPLQHYLSSQWITMLAHISQRKDSHYCSGWNLEKIIPNNLLRLKSILKDILTRCAPLNLQEKEKLGRKSHIYTV